MKAVVLTEARTPELQEVAEPVPAEGEVLIAVEACGICGTDLHASEISMFIPPVVMGHEFAGKVVEVGDGVSHELVGTRVAVNPLGITCGMCWACRSGQHNYCQPAVYEQSIGVARNGGMAEYVAVPARTTYRLPDSVGPIAGAWVEPLAVAVRAVAESPFKAGDRVAVSGAGPIGLLIAQLLLHLGAANLTVIEPSDYRRQMALALGAKTAAAPGTIDVHRFAGEVDGVFECSGHPSALEGAIAYTRHGGYIRMVGVATQPVVFESINAIHKELQISGSFIYVGEFPQAISLLESGAVSVDDLSNVVPLDSYADAFKAASSSTATIKAVIDVSRFSD